MPPWVVTLASPFPMHCSPCCEDEHPLARKRLYLKSQPPVFDGFASTLCRQILLVLDSVDILYEAGGIEARKSMIAILDELCRTSENLTLLLTCKEQLLRDCDGYLRNTNELVGTMYCYVCLVRFRYLSIKEDGKSYRLVLYVT